MKKLGKMNEEFLKGFVKGEFRCNVTNTQEQIAAFIFKYGKEGNDVEIKDSNDDTLISSFGPYINKCEDQDYLMNGFQQLMTSLQCGEKEIEFKEPVLSELFPDMELVSGVAAYVEESYCMVTIIFENGKLDLFHIDSKYYYTKPQLLKEYPHAISCRDTNKIGLEKGLISKETFFNNQLKYALYECWEISDSDIENWISTFEELVKNNIVKDMETCVKIVETDQYFNRYDEIEDYSELAQCMITDDVIWDDDNDEDYLFLKEHQYEESVVKEFLLNDGWFISSNGIAIGLSEEVLSKKFLSDKNKIQDPKN